MNTATASQAWTRVGLVLAMFGIPLCATAYRLAYAPLDANLILLRELTLFAGAGLLLLLVRRGERLPWSSIGMRRMPFGRAALWVLLGFLGCAVAVALGFGLLHVAGVSYGNGTLSPHPIPLWLTSLVMLRAGTVEELCFRGYAIERLQALTGKRWLAVALPLIVFAGLHYTQGPGGILMALLLGGVLSGLYLWKRNLWLNMTVHFLVDFVPNVLLAQLPN